MYFVKLPATALLDLVRNGEVRLDPYMACCFLVARELKNEHLMVGVLRNFASLDDLTGHNVAFFLFCDSLEADRPESEIIRNARGEGIAFDGAINQRLGDSDLKRLVRRFTYDDSDDVPLPWEELIGIPREKIREFRQAPTELIDGYLTSMTTSVNSLKRVFSLQEEELPCVLVSDSKLRERRVFRLTDYSNAEQVYDVLRSVICAIDAYDERKRNLAARKDELYHRRKHVLAAQDFGKRLRSIQENKKRGIRQAIANMVEVSDPQFWNDLDAAVTDMDVSNSSGAVDDALRMLEDHDAGIRKLMQNARYIRKHIRAWKRHAMFVDEFSQTALSDIDAEANAVRSELERRNSMSIMDVLEVVDTPDVRQIEVDRRMHGVFLSHRSHDKEWVGTLARDLLHSGYQVWLDEWEIKGGDWFATKISEGLASARYVLVVLSRASTSSDAGWVKAEWTSALARELSGVDIKVIPVLKELCVVPDILRG
jgi:hypothetical protein